MSGIGDYFHGEEADVLEVNWIPHGDYLSYAIELANNPHRKRAQAYGSDIGIDPLIRPKDHVIYIRLSSYCGIWVKSGMQFSPELDAALVRVAANTERCRRYSGGVLAQLWAQRLRFSTGIEVLNPTKAKPFDRDSIPVIEESVFLSHSGRNTLLARFLFEALRRDGKREVWFDLAEAAEAPTHQGHIEKWLQSSLHECRVFVVMLTEASALSPWVRKEASWATEKAGQDANFHMVLLNLEGASAPWLEPHAKYIVDCAGLALGEIEEELYAAVYKRTNRREWLDQQAQRGWKDRTRSERYGYEHLMSDGGVAIALNWTREGPTERWEILFECDGSKKRATGIGPYQVVDVDIHEGDRIGGVAFMGMPSPLWMRSDDLELRFGEVLSKYEERVGGPEKWNAQQAMQICFTANLYGSRFKSDQRH